MTSDYGPEAREVLEAARRADDPSEQQLRRTGRVLALRLGVGAAATLTSATAWGGFWSKVTIALLLAGATGAGTSLWWRATASSKASGKAVAPLAAKPSAPDSVPVFPDIAAPANKPVHHATQRRLASSARATLPNGLEEETALVASANRKLDAGERSGALALLDEYDRLFPRGLLREESAATRTIVHCQLDGGRHAGAWARHFREQHARSPLLPRVEHACLGDTR